MQRWSLTSWGLNTQSKDHSLVVTKEHGNLWYHVGYEYSSYNWQGEGQKTLFPLCGVLVVSPATPKHLNHSIYFDMWYYEGSSIILKF